MKLLGKFLSILVVISTTTTSCVSNYISTNTSYKYPTTNELLAHNSKGPNANKINVNKLVSEKPLVVNKSSLDNIEVYTEKAFTQEAYNLIGEAKTYLGTPYRYGGTTRNGIDCSSFVQHVFNAFNISLPRTSALQSLEGEKVSMEELQKGDLIFFAHTPKSRVSHVGIVESVSPTGEIFFIHASSSQGVTITSLDMAYWKKRFRSGKRVLNMEDKMIQIQNGDFNENMSLVKASY